MIKPTGIIRDCTMGAELSITLEHDFRRGENDSSPVEFYRVNLYNQKRTESEEFTSADDAHIFFEELKSGLQMEKIERYSLVVEANYSYAVSAPLSVVLKEMSKQGFITIENKYGYKEAVMAKRIDYIKEYSAWDDCGVEQYKYVGRNNG